jgi:tRNA(Arg) A34 adenosine deaminase TadA
MNDEHWMRLAIETSRRGIEAGQSPFGAVIVKGDELVVAAHNVVWLETDATAHAEVNAIRLACRKLGTIDLRGCRIYSTTEPCPMCFAACHWAKLDQIYFGTSIPDANASGFSELFISNQQMKDQGRSPIGITPNVLRDEAAELFRLWQAKAGRKVY